MYGVLDKWKSLLATILICGIGFVALAALFTPGTRFLLKVVDSQRIPPSNMTKIAQQTTTIPMLEKGGKMEKIAQRFQERRLHLVDICPLVNTSLEESNHQLLQSFVIDHLQYCSIPKIGTQYIIHTLEPNLKYWKFSHPEDFKKLANTQQIRFAFVREPYSRLLSGFIDKMMTFPQWLPWIQHNVVAGAGVSRRPSWNQKCSATHVTFTDFVRYFIKSETKPYTVTRDVHFKPMHDICHFCTGNFTFIGHLETFAEDVSYLASLFGKDLDVILGEDVYGVMREKAERNLKKEFHFLKNCTDTFTVMQKLWMSFQLRGFISEAYKMPVSKVESVSMTAYDFFMRASKAHDLSKGSFDHKLQKRRMMVQMYLQVPLKHRLMLRQMLLPDFVLFKYDSQPADIFPELS